MNAAACKTTVDTANIELRVACVDDSVELLQFLHQHYYPEEPLTAGCEPKQPDEADEQFQLSNLIHGTCLLALQQGRIVGAAVAGPKLPDEADQLFAEAEQLVDTKWGRILGILAIVERDANVFKRYNVDKALHLHAMAVDVTLRGRNLGERLIFALADRGRSLGYPLLTSDCSSFYSARLMKRLKFELINTLPYTDYVDASGVQLICPTAPHVQLETYVLRL